MTEKSDATLVADVLNGRTEAFEDLVHRHQHYAYGTAISVLSDFEMAQDVVQEAFLAVWRQSNSFRPDKGSARAWLFSIVRHRVIDVTRGRTFINERMSLGEINFEPRQPDVWHRVSAGLDNHRVKQAVETLPDGQREAITLAY